MIIRYLLILLLVLWSATAQAATWYIGTTWNACAGGCVDDTDCGTTAANSCATLEYFNDNRRASVVASGDIVRLAPETFGGTAGNTSNCILYQSGVTYEGRTVADAAINTTGCGVSGGLSGTCDYTNVPVIDGTNQQVSCSNSGPCLCNGIRALTNSAVNSNVVIRDMKVTNFSHPNPSVFIEGGAGTDSITLSRLLVTNADGAGIRVENNANTTFDCAPTAGGQPVRDISNLTIEDSLIHDTCHNAGGIGGIAVGCVDGFEIARNEVYNCFGSTCTANLCATSPGNACGCDDRDGIQVSGAIRGRISDNLVYDVGEDNLDLGGHWYESYYLTVERNAAHGSGRNVKFSGGQHHILLRNNILWNSKNDISQCAHTIRVQNNTIFNPNGIAFRTNDYNPKIDYIDNIFVGNRSSSDMPVSFGYYTKTEANDGAWDYNLVYNQDTAQPALKIFNYLSASCTPLAATACGDIANWSLPACPAYPTSSQEGFLNTQQANWVSDDYMEATTGATGTNDVWNCFTGMFIDPANPSVANLHLKSSDTCAKDNGVSISQAGTCVSGRCEAGYYGAVCTTNADCTNSNALDFDGDIRTLVDIGADETGGTTTTTTVTTTTSTTTTTLSGATNYMNDPSIQGCYLFDASGDLGKDSCGGTGSGDDPFSLAGTTVPTYDSTNKQQGTGSVALGTGGGYLNCIGSSVCPNINAKGDAALTIVAWSKLTATNNWRTIMAQGGDGNTNRSYRFRAVTGGTAPSGTIQASGVEVEEVAATSSTTAWTHLCEVYDGANVTMYVLGVQDCSTPGCDAQTGTIGAGSAGTDVKIGASISSSGVVKDFHKGNIDELAVFNRALGGTECCEICRMGLNGQTSDRGTTCNSCTLPGGAPLVDSDASLGIDGQGWDLR